MSGRSDWIYSGVIALIDLLSRAKVILRSTFNRFLNDKRFCRCDTWIVRCFHAIDIDWILVVAHNFRHRGENDVGLGCHILQHRFECPHSILHALQEPWSCKSDKVRCSITFIVQICVSTRTKWLPTKVLLEQINDFLRRSFRVLNCDRREIIIDQCGQWEFPQTRVGSGNGWSFPRLLNRSVIQRVGVVKCFRSRIDRNTTIVEESSLFQNFSHVIVVLQVRSSEANDLLFRNTR